MNKKHILKNLILAVILITIFILAKPRAEAFWVSFMNFTNPGYYDTKLKEWSDKSTDFLIGKLGHPAPSWDGVAGNILARRKDLSREQKLVRVLNSDWSIERRRSSLSILFIWNEPKAIDLSMKIIESNRENPLYIDALRHLSHRKYEPAYPYVVALAKESDPFANGSIGMLKNFGKTESIPLLQAMVDRVRPQDKMVERMDKSSILNAIHSIKQQNKITE